MEQYNVNKMALKWMYELEMLSDPTLQKNLKENILISDKNIKECELLIYQKQKSILVYLEIGFFSKLFKRHNKIAESVNLIVSELLPTFRKRIVFDRAILDLSLQKAKEALGDFNEKTINDNNNNSDNDDSIKRDTKAETSKTSDNESDIKEQTEDK